MKIKFVKVLKNSIKIGKHINDENLIIKQSKTYKLIINHLKYLIFDKDINSYHYPNKFIIKTYINDYFK